ncbi:MAG: hypothetical protein WB791_02555 [Waddliaceae bacterium]
MARFACMAIVNFLQDDQLTSNRPIPEQFIEAIRNNAKESGFLNELKHLVGKQVEQGEKSRQLFHFFHFDSCEVAVDHQTEAPWRVDELLSQCGIRTQAGYHYFGQTTKHDRYGFRLGTEIEANALGMQSIEIAPIRSPHGEKKHLPSAIDVGNNLTSGTRRSHQGRANLIDALRAFSESVSKQFGHLSQNDAAFGEMIKNLHYRIEELEIERSPAVRDDGLSAFGRVKKGLEDFYKSKPALSLAFSNRELELNQAFVQLALVQEKEQQVKEPIAS